MYRSTRGSQAFAAVHKHDQPQPRLTRTSFKPFADLKHPGFSYEDPPLSAKEQHAAEERATRHGVLHWGLQMFGCILLQRLSCLITSHGNPWRISPSHTINCSTHQLSK